MAAKKKTDNSSKTKSKTSATSKKPLTAAQKRAGKISAAVSSPAKYAASSKIKKKAYNRAEVERKRAAYEKSGRKKLGNFLETFTPMAVFGPATRAITGRNWTAEGTWEQQQKKTKNRLGDAGIALLYSGMGQGKAVGKVAKAVKKGKQARAADKIYQEIRKSGANKRRGATEFNKRKLS